MVSPHHHTHCCCESLACVHFLIFLICAIAATCLLQEVPRTFLKMGVHFVRCAGALLCPHCRNRYEKVLRSCEPFRRWPRRAVAPGVVLNLEAGDRQFSGTLRARANTLSGLLCVQAIYLPQDIWVLVRYVPRE